MKATRYDVIVVGGGLAGLTAAILAAQGHARVVVVERSSRLGGRARTSNRNGYQFNLGAHALYRGGVAATTLAALGVAFDGAPPSLSGLLAYRHDQLHTFPSGGLSLLVSGLFALDSKHEYGKFFAELETIDADAFDSLTIAQWLSSTIVNADVRDTIRALIRLTTFVDASAPFSAGAAIRQLQLARAGALYLHGGWQTMVDGLTACAESKGVDIRRACAVRDVVSTDAGVVAVLDGAECIEAVAAILAVPPAAALNLTGGPDRSPSLARQLEGTAVARVACLDVAVRRLPKPSHTFAIGIDQPFYLSVHSAVARLAPPGGALIHTAKFLGNAPANAVLDRADLELWLDVIQPGWREHVEVIQHLPEMTAVPLVPSVAAGGLAGRPGPALPDHPRILVAGDWVGADGQLADASVASATQAASMALRMVNAAATPQVA
jgi:phytoene dehydrogenase-like protein